MLTFLFFILLLLSLFTNFVLVLEIERLKLENFQKTQVPDVFKKPPQTVSIAGEVGSLEPQALLDQGKKEKSTSAFEPTTPVWKLPGLLSQQTGFTLFSRDAVLYPPIINTYVSTEILNESPTLLVNWLNRSKVGFMLLNNKELPSLYLNPVILDIESTDKQLLVGFYFASLNTFVQFVLDVNDSAQVQEKFLTLLKNFFIELNSISKTFEQELDSTENGETKIYIFTFLAGYNINNFDLPVLNKILPLDPKNSNIISEARTLIKELFTVRDRSDFVGYAGVLTEFFFVDLFWKTGGRLKDWINILNQTELFKPLTIKRWEQPKTGRVNPVELYGWFVYNRNDLAATHLLGIYQNNYYNYVLQRLAYGKVVSPNTSLIEVFRQRFLK